MNELNNKIWDVLGGIIPVIVDGKPRLLRESLEQAHSQITEQIRLGIEEFKAKRMHLKKNDSVSFCGWGVESGAHFVEIIEDATCKSCVKLALKSDTTLLEGEK